MFLSNIQTYMKEMFLYNIQTYTPNVYRNQTLKSCNTGATCKKYKNLFVCLFTLVTYKHSGVTLGCRTQEEHCICIFSLGVSLCPPKFFSAKVAINFQNLRLPVSGVTIGQSQGQYFTAHVKLLCREAILAFFAPVTWGNHFYYHLRNICYNYHSKKVSWYPALFFWSMRLSTYLNLHSPARC